MALTRSRLELRLVVDSGEFAELAVAAVADDHVAHLRTLMGVAACAAVAALVETPSRHAREEDARESPDTALTRGGRVFQGGRRALQRMSVTRPLLRAGGPMHTTVATATARFEEDHHEPDRG